MDPRFASESFWRRLDDALAHVPRDEQTPPPKARAGAVLVLLEDTPHGPRVVLTRRRQDLRSHPGQISFPGGRIDPGETVEQAALREAAEEVGLRAESARVVGAGPMFYIPPSRFWVVPVVARWVEPHELHENPWEVDEILRIPLAWLLDHDRQRQVDRTQAGASWAWQLDDDLLWGATARVLAVVLDLAVEGWHAGRRPEDLGDERAVRPWERAPAWQRRQRLEEVPAAIEQDRVPHVNAVQVRGVRTWLATRGVDTAVCAEQAGRAVVGAVRRMRPGTLPSTRVTVLAGPSSNGAAGLAAARILAGTGAQVTVLTVGPPRLPAQTHMLRDAGVQVRAVTGDDLGDDTDPGDLVVDAMLGVGAEPPLRDLPDAAASWLRRFACAIVAVDLPSGLAADAGARGPCVTADVTVALGLPTLALREEVVQPYLGDLYVADLGIPTAAWRSVGVEAPPELFAGGQLVRLLADAVSDAATPDQVAEPDPSPPGRHGDPRR